MADLEAELARFEAEIAAVDQTHQPARPAPHTSQVRPPMFPTSARSQYNDPYHVPPPDVYHSQHMGMPMGGPMGMGMGMPPPMMPPPMMPPPAMGMAPNMGMGVGMPGPSGMPPMGMVNHAPTPAVVSAAPVATTVAAAAAPARPGQQGLSIAQLKAQEAEKKAKEQEAKKGKGPLRAAAGKVWRDPSLEEWPENDHRIFVGDLGNEVTDDVLAKAFNKYSSFVKAKVVRDKRTNKSKGFGFVSFTESNDYAKAMREMNGKYIGNRPCKLSKSTWDERSLHTKRKDGGGGQGGSNKKQKR